MCARGCEMQMDGGLWGAGDKWGCAHVGAEAGGEHRLWEPAQVPSAPLSHGHL